jgi:muramoyltetrapeptide carboxypeptidase
MASKLVPIQPGDAIGVIALSAPCEPARFANGLAALEAFGFKTKVALDPTANYGKTTNLFSSDTPVNRAKAFHELFADPKIKAVIAARGAFGSMEVLPHIDFRTLAKTPKPFIGFSDLTAINCALYQLSNVPTIHGPTIESTFAKDDSQAKQSAQVLIDLLSGKVINPFSGSKLTPLIKGTNCAGPLIGGNLSMLAALMGTPWEPSFDDHILYFEELGESPYRIHRMLLQIKLSGNFGSLRGVVIGSMRDCVHPKGLGPTVNEVITNIFADVGCPVWTGAPFGHELLNLPLLNGANASISANQLEFT